MTVGHSMTVSDTKESIDDLSVWYQSINYTYRVAIIGVAVCVFCANAMCSKTTVRHFDAQSLTWPSKSLSLSPIEHVWDALDNSIRNRVQPRARQELEIALHEELPTIQDSTLHQWENVAEHASLPKETIRDIEL